ncbi:hypothetical protein [Gimesia maris]|uniref:Uncharacterized protein n=2 Tax=Gimesia maris TaxID=122 RepID=A0ABX5YS46_9PLAN|nr:hypothetical protein [Gimesia maris]QDU16409.1 hypothetical protein CA11_42400 [Gimesia maris]QEG18456.1 hypothetical protein GmarT_43450 [Gimesia maris]QGQ28571.1 hypothetical protein F1729_07890 [Gimesia maris]
MRMTSTILLLFTMFFVGCGNGTNQPSSETDAVNTNNITSTADMKAALESIAETGEMGSAAMGFRETLEGLKQSDAAKADKLLSDLDKLEASKSPAETKKIAKEMAGKL